MFYVVICAFAVLRLYWMNMRAGIAGLVTKHNRVIVIWNILEMVIAQYAMEATEISFWKSV